MRIFEYIKNNKKKIIFFFVVCAILSYYDGYRGKLSLICISKTSILEICQKDGAYKNEIKKMVFRRRQ
jgi:hypothetical protein